MSLTFKLIFRTNAYNQSYFECGPVCESTFVCLHMWSCMRTCVHACARVPLLLAVLSLYLKMVAPVVLFVLSVHNNLEFVI